MKQVLQNLNRSITEFGDASISGSRRDHWLVRTTRMLVSEDAERMLVECGRAGWMEQAPHQPDKLKLVLDKIRTDELPSAVGFAEVTWWRIGGETCLLLGVREHHGAEARSG